MSEQDFFSGQNIPPELLKRLLSVRSEEELNKLVKEHPQLIPILNKMTASILDSQEKQILDRLPEILEKLERLKSPSEMPRRIALCEEALSLIDRKTEPELWTGLNVELANSLVQNPQGDRAENMDRAICYYKLALEVFTSERFTVEWAKCHNNLGAAYCDRIRGDRAENIERAIEYCNLALGIHTHDAFPVYWAMTQLTLGRAYVNRICNSRAENLEQAIKHHNLALEILTRKAFPEYWARAQLNMGNAYTGRICGDHAENIERAIEYYNLALEVYTRKAFPWEWAITQSNIGNAYWNRICGSRAENLERAIEHYNLALEILTRNAFPEDWASAQRNMGTAYWSRILGKRSDNLECAIKYYNLGMEIYTYKEFPIEWAKIQIDFGNVYKDRICGSRAENLERAIEHYNLALEILTRKAFPMDWAMTQHNLGNAYRDRIRGDHAENHERAIGHYDMALAVRIREQFPFEWAKTQNTLAAAYWECISGNRAENLERAIEHYNLALEILTRKAFPMDWAMTQHNLGNAYRDRIRGDHAENHERAIEYYNMALKIRTRDEFPEDWAVTQNDLGNIFSMRIQGDRAENIEQSINHYNRALEVRTHEEFPVKWAMTQHNLGAAYSDRIRGERANNVEKAIGHFNQALREYTREVFPLEHRRTLINLGHLYFDNNKWKDALEQYNNAINVSKMLFQTSYTEAGRHAEVSDTSQVHARAAYCLLQQDEPEPDNALLMLEQGKARLLAEALMLSNDYLDQIPDEFRKDIIDARKGVRELEVEMRLSENTPARRITAELGKQLEYVRRKLSDCIDSLCKKYPGLLPRELTFKDILSLAPEDGALIAPLITPKGSVVFVIPHGLETISMDNVVPINDFNQTRLKSLLVGTEEDPGWFRVYRNYHPIKSSIDKLLNAMDTLTEKLWDELMLHIHNKLKDFDIKKDAHVIILPQGGLGLLPLHAARYEVDGVKRTFLDDYTVSYAPSAYVLSIVKKRIHERHQEASSLFYVSNPTRDLSYATMECLTIERLFDNERKKILKGNDATVDAVKRESPGYTHLHFNCHGFYNWQDAMKSGLKLANENNLTMADVISHMDLHVTRLVVLSACETGMTEFTRVPDEHIGLTTGFIQAGAGSVVSTLWAVEVFSTMLLMERFYENHISKGEPLPMALKNAQLWLRDKVTNDYIRNRLADELNKSGHEYILLNKKVKDTVTNAIENLKEIEEIKSDERPYNNPFFWAAFTYTGA